MNTTPERLRHALLVILDRNRTRFGLDAKALEFRLRLELSIMTSESDIIDALEYLAGARKPLVEEMRPEINRANRVFKITEHGIRYVDEHNL